MILRQQQLRILRNSRDLASQMNQMPQIKFVLGMNCSQQVDYLIGELIMCLFIGRTSNILTNLKFFSFYIHGGQDLKEGSYGDLWRVDYSFIFDENKLVNDFEMENLQWEEVKLQGKHPKKLSHHGGVLQANISAFIIYGGIIGMDSCDILYVIDLNNFSVDAIPPARQTERNGKPLPGPRDDFSFVTPNKLNQNGGSTIYLIGGFKNGMKMGDIYKLHVLESGKKFEWELLEVQGRPYLPPRSSLSANVLIDPNGNEKLLVFGGAGDNSVRYNDIWIFSEHTWTEIKPINQDQSEVPQERGGHQSCVFGDRFLIVFGGIHDITYELNDLHIFDIKENRWFLGNENNQNASQSGSPRNKAIMQQSDAFKKHSVQLNLGGNAKGQTNRMSGSNGFESPLNQTFQKAANLNDSVRTTRGKSLFQSSINPLSDNPKDHSRMHMKSPPKALQIQTTHKIKNEGNAVELLTPTSISMKNAFIIKNADQSFDHYFQIMKRRKGYGGHHTSVNSPAKTQKKHTLNQSMISNGGHSGHHHHHHHANYSAFISAGHREEPLPKVKITDEKQPAGRDGHSAWLEGDKWIIFGGDRHHMPYNDTYVLDLSKLINV
ncbi:kelch motif family protein [Stylonychia lemnae]|uniref:Kelch motif family protein n=1 Tax=Stylonychia lemnae TaxID=5949 RepID=A0A078B0W4_STYLE|nr:kelch motif family protein [Stylonychia lemnae]|eukprot:CDW87956.1 kelch motif family protein [Stylonychia lemnae]